MHFGKNITSNRWVFWLPILFCLAFLWAFQGSFAQAQDNKQSLQGYVQDVEVTHFFAAAENFEIVEGVVTYASVFDVGNNLLGHIFLNTDFVPSIGYSGKPIYILVGVDEAGTIHGAKMVEHSEPIILVGVPIAKIDAFTDGYKGVNPIELATEGTHNKMPVDIVSGATVTVIVMDDSIRRSASMFMRSLGLAPALVEGTGPQFILDESVVQTSDWLTLAGDGSVRRLRLSIDDVNNAFVLAGNERAIARPLTGVADEIFIDIYTALVSQEAIGRTLLGSAEYANLQDKIEDGQQAIIIAANGTYSFRGSGFVRGGIFDRFQLIQGEKTWLFRDKQYKRLGDFAGDDAPHFSEIGLFTIPNDEGFDPTKPWRIQLLIQRQIGALDRAFVTRDLPYHIPSQYLVAIADETPDLSFENSDVEPLFKMIWETRKADVIILSLAIVFLTGIFFSQNWVASRPVLLGRVRTGFLIFTLFWLGFYTNAQISVVNIFTYFNSILSGFSWSYFLMDPLIFLLWGSVAAALIIWGRGVFCGWLCPFGALQELLSMIAKRIGIKQIQVPWAIHERLWPIKYMIFLSLFGLSLYSLPLAERMAEVEPFKTVIILKFARDWPFVIYALTLLSVGLFIERFYCRYVCPLGAALAIPGRMRINDWIKRYHQCGSPCQRCANECMVQAIHPEGNINVNECLYCLHCQELYVCEDRCPVMIKKKQRREKLEVSNI